MCNWEYFNQSKRAFKNLQPHLCEKIYIYNKIYITYMLKRQSQRGRNRGNLTSTALLLSWLQWPVLGQAEIRIQELLPVFLCGCEDPSTRTVFCYFSQAISRDHDWKQNSWDLRQPIMGCQCHWWQLHVLYHKVRICILKLESYCIFCLKDLIYSQGRVIERVGETEVVIFHPQIYSLPGWPQAGARSGQSHGPRTQHLAVWLFAAAHQHGAKPEEQCCNTGC